MLQELPFPPRTECPPGLCVCNRDALLSDPQGDTRILMLTREQEKKLVDRIDCVKSYEELLHVGKQMYDKLGIVLTIRPSVHEVRTVRGIQILLEEQPGLCRKTRQAVPAAIRRCLEQHPEIAYAILNAHDLLGS
jgi:hypothetical protein